MHPLVLLPLLASLTILHPVAAVPMEFSTPIAVPGAGVVTVGLLLPSNVPNLPAVPKKPFRREYNTLEPRQVIGYGHNPPSPESTRMIKTRRSLLGDDSSNVATGSGRTLPRPHAGTSGHDSELASLPNAGSETGPSISSTSPESGGSLLSDLPVSKAGSAVGSAPGATHDLPETPAPQTATAATTPTGAEKEITQEPAEITSTKANTGVYKENEVTDDGFGAVHENTVDRSTYNPTYGPPYYTVGSHHHSQGPPRVERRSMTSYYHSVDSRSFTNTGKDHSVVFDTDTLIPPQDPGPDYDPRMGLVNVDSNSKPKPDTKKIPQTPDSDVPTNSTLPAN